MSHNEDRSLCFQRQSLHGMERSVTAEQVVDKAARKRFGAVDHALRLLASQFFSNLHALFGSNSLYLLDDEKLLKRNAVEQLPFTAPTRSPLFSLLLQENVQSLQMKQPAAERPRVTDLEDEGNCVRPPAVSA